MPKTKHTPIVIGQQFNRLTVIAGPFRKSNGNMDWECRCMCGKTKRITTGHLTTSTQSCGCLHKERVAIVGRSNMKHGDNPRSGESIEYSCWHGMKQRCYTTTNAAYHNYGGRGIAVCDRWRDSYEAFLFDMGRRPPECDSLDRFPNNNGNYEPGNCRWATSKQQGRNTRVNRLLTHDGETKCVAAWAEDLGIGDSTILHRLKKCWPLDKALSSRKFTRWGR